MESSQSETREQRILDVIPLLVRLGQSEDPAVLGGLALPSGSEFGVFWQAWDTVIKGWDPADVAHLIKGLTLYEKFSSTGFGSVPPVAQLFHLYSWAVKTSESQLLADWILANTINDYVPYGTNNFGARSLAELDAKKSARAARKQATAESERTRMESARSARALAATQKLPNALKRKDAAAVAALIAKGADPDAPSPSGNTSREIAKELGIEAWLEDTDKRAEA